MSKKIIKTTAADAALVAANQPAVLVADTAEQIAATAAAQQEQAKEVETKSMVLPKGTKETSLYLITPPINGKPRWFEKKRMTSIAKEGDLFTVAMPVKAFNDRKMEMAS